MTTQKKPAPRAPRRIETPPRAQWKQAPHPERQAVCDAAMQLVRVILESGICCEAQNRAVKLVLRAEKLAYLAILPYVSPAVAQQICDDHGVGAGERAKWGL